jgi:hypothetical protein
MLAAAVALKVPVAAPAATVIDPGRVSAGLLLDRLTVEPPAGAAVFKVAEQFATPLAFKVPGAQVRDEMIGTRIVAPAVAETGNAAPVASTPIGFDRNTEIVVALGTRVICTVAAIPVPIVFVFNPVKRHVSRPGAEVQESALPAAVAAGPRVAATAEIWLDGKARLHCTPAGAVPETPSERLREMVDPGLADAEDKLRVGTCANKRSHGSNNANAQIKST